MIVRPHSFLLDAEALSALAVADRRMQAWATVARRSGSSLHASTLTLAEVDADVERRFGRAVGGRLQFVHGRLVGRAIAVDVTLRGRHRDRVRRLRRRGARAGTGGR